MARARRMRAIRATLPQSRRKQFLENFRNAELRLRLAPATEHWDMLAFHQNIVAWIAHHYLPSDDPDSRILLSGMRAANDIAMRYTKTGTVAIGTYESAPLANSVDAASRILSKVKEAVLSEATEAALKGMRIRQ